jgi:membrane protease YdiL (CAAX protease family)
MKKFINLFLFITVVSITLFLPIINFGLYIKLLLTLISWVIGIYLFFNNFKLFVPTFFFLLNTILSPLSFLFMKKYSINFPQVYFLLSILVYLIIVLSVPKFRNNITWMKFGTFDKTTILLMCIMTILTGLSLFIWAFFIKKDLSEFQKFIPNIPLAVLILYGIVFPICNSLFEEFMARAVLFDGFSYIFKNVVIVIIFQALIFSLWHYNGFPGGIIGVILVFIWSIFLGIIRFRSKGMLPPLIAHFFADLSISIIILFLVILPSNST